MGPLHSATALSFFGMVDSGATADRPRPPIGRLMPGGIILCRLVESSLYIRITSPVTEFASLSSIGAMIVHKVSLLRRWTTVFMILFTLFTLAGKLSSTSTEMGTKKKHTPADLDSRNQLPSSIRTSRSATSQASVSATAHMPTRLARSVLPGRPLTRWIPSRSLSRMDGSTG